ncbi:MAG: transposase [Deltaproteobacteria bacterium]|nr:transposase [Deltaproteobacteria bacterium]
MSRFARIYFPGGLYHLMSRFVGGQPLIRTQKQRSYYLKLIAEAVQKTDATLYAYAVLPTQVHLVVRAGWEPLERLMKSVNTGYAGWLNNQQAGRGGAVFAGRYKSVLLEDNYVFDLVRYVHNAPVRLKKAKAASESGWTSHQAYVGDAEVPDWLDVNFVLEQINPKIGWARRQFDTFVNETSEEGRRRDLEGSKSDEMSRAYRTVLAEHLKIDGPIVGSEEFIEMVYKEVFAKGPKNKAPTPSRMTLNRLIETVREELNIDKKDFVAFPKRKPCALARRVIVYIWVAEFGGKQNDVSKRLSASTGAVTRWYGKAIRDLNAMEPLVVKILEKMR